MAKAMYIGVGGVARKIKKMYIGVGGVARKIKKMYIGVGGVARCILSGGEVTYVGALTNLTSSRDRMGAASTAAHAIFAGGHYGTTYTGNTDAYNTSLVSVSASVPTLSGKRADPSALTIGGSALFAGGVATDSSVSSIVDSFNTELVRSTLSTLYRAKAWMLCAVAGLYAVFAGGKYVYLGMPATALEVEAYSNTLVKTRLTDMSTGRRLGAGASVGGYGLIAGGENNDDKYDIVEAYSSTLVRTTLSVLCREKWMLAGASVGNYALFAGGSYGADTQSTSSVDVYNASLVKSTGTSLQNARNNIAGVSLSSFALFLGGAVDNTHYSDVDIYNDSLVRTTGPLLPTYGIVTATNFGPYCICGDGSMAVAYRAD